MPQYTPTGLLRSPTWLLRSPAGLTGVGMHLPCALSLSVQVRGKHLALPFGMLTEGGGGGSGGGGGGSSAPASAAGGPEGSPASPGEPGPGDGKRKAAGKKRAPSEDMPATLGDLAAEWIAALGSRRERKSTILFAAEVGCSPSSPPLPLHTDTAAPHRLSADRCVVGSVLVACEAASLSVLAFVRWGR
jgi:hypothetical protein